MPTPKREKAPALFGAPKGEDPMGMMGEEEDEEMGMGGEFEDEAKEAFPDMTPEQMGCLKRAIQALVKGK
jgi:hypothetical protein